MSSEINLQLNFTILMFLISLYFVNSFNENKKVRDFLIALSTFVIGTVFAISLFWG